MDRLMTKEARLYLVFDKLGDLRRSGPIQWCVDRFRTADIKDHIFDLILLTKMIKPYIPESIDTDRMIDYAITHDLEEVITGDITTFEGVTREEKDRVNKIAMDYLISEYGGVLNLNTILADFEELKDLEAKVLHMLDKVQSSIEFLKYDSEKKVDMDNSEIVECLRNNPDVLKLRAQGLSLGEIFYRWHMRSVNFSDEELVKYGITRETADNICSTIKSIMESIHDQFNRYNEIEDDFPEDAMIYRNINNKNNRRLV